MTRYFIPDFPLVLVSTSLLRCTHTPTLRSYYQPFNSSDPHLRQIGR
jgi:hypothetical protein